MPPGSAPPTAKKAATSASKAGTPAAAPASKGKAGTPAAAAKGTPAAAGTPSLWNPKEESALKAAVSKLGPETPNRWERVAQAVGGGKTKDACKKHAKELGK